MTPDKATANPPLPGAMPGRTPENAQPPADFSPREVAKSLLRATRVGTLALMQGGAGISQDLPPFTIATGVNTICGLNIIGLRRAGFSAEQRLELKQLYKYLFRSGKNFRAAVAEAQEKFTSPGAKIMLEFVAAAKRGVCSDLGASTRDNEEE